MRPRISKRTRISGWQHWQKNGLVLEHAADHLRADKDVVLAAIAEDGNAFQFAADSLRSNKEFVLEAVKTSGKSLQFVPDHLRNDREIVKAAGARSGNALTFAKGGLNQNSETLKAARQKLKMLKSGLGCRRISTRRVPSGAPGHADKTK